MSSEWDALSASLNSLEAEFSTSSKAASSTGANKHSAEIDAILKSRGKHRGTGAQTHKIGICSISLLY
jgi:hypothetical protein